SYVTYKVKFLMVNNPFTCRFTIEAINTIATGIYSVNGRLFDASVNEFGPNDVQVGFIFFDESAIDASVVRWKITSIIQKGVPFTNSITVQCMCDDVTEPRMPVPGSGVMCEATTALRL